VAENAALLNGDRRLIAVAGESAGGNLAAGVTLMARNRGEFALIYQLLIYPATQYQSHTPSFHQYGENYFLTADLTNWFWDHYLPSPTEGKNPYASPLLAENLANLPPGLIVTAEFDPLRDEGEIYGDRLREAGVEIKTIRYDGTIHGFINFAKFLPLGQTALKEIGAILQTAFTQGKNQSQK
jgi:acetyl esterase